MISVPEALDLIAARAPRLGSTSIPAAQAVGHILHTAVMADRDAPPFDRVMMDGIAIRYADWLNPGTVLSLQDTVPAGTNPPALGSEPCAIGVMTGGVLPPGCDTVIPVENVVHDGDQVRLVGSPSDSAAGSFVHRRGSDLKQGNPVLRAGIRLGAPELGIAATEGIGHLTVNTLPRVHLITTGDEVVPVEASPLPHQIRRSHAAALEPILRGWGNIQWSSQHVADDPRALKLALQTSLANTDLLLVAGGMSKGRWDLGPELLQEAGVTRVFHRVAQKPGKPLWYGVTDTTQVLGLPGNPVSAMCCARRYGWAALDAATGAMETPPAVLSLSNAVPRLPSLTLYAPVLATASGWQTVLPANSGHLHGLAGTTGFVQIDPGPDTISALLPLPYFPWS